MKSKTPLRHWTKEELDYLENSWGRVSIPTISKNLNRSIEAIKIKAGKLKLGATLESGDYITFNQLVQAVTGGTTEHNYQLKSWVENRGFPMRIKKVNKCSFRIVYLEEFWKWAEKNRSFIDFSKMQKNILGKEPDWVAEQRHKDYISNSLQRKDVWTSAEDERLKFLVKQQKYGYAELSKMLKRSEGAISRRCITLGIKDRPLKADNHGAKAVWTNEMYKILAVGIRSGDSYAIIAEKIGKSEKAVRGKVYTKYFTEDADKVRLMLGDGNWRDNAPQPKVKQAFTLSGYRASTPKQLTALATILKYRLKTLYKGEIHNELPNRPKQMG